MVLDIILFLIFIYACVAFNNIIWTWLELGSIVLHEVTKPIDNTQVINIGGEEYNIQTSQEQDESFVNGAIWSYAWE